MARRELTQMRHEEVKRLLGMGISVRKISQALRCSKVTVRKIRDNEIAGHGSFRELTGPVWTDQIDWDEVLKDFQLGHPLKFVWEEKAKEKITYVNFWKQFYKRFPECKRGLVTHREFTPGERGEVDWSGFKIEWIDIRTGEIYETCIFIGALGFSQYIFAGATPDEKTPNFLESHSKMYEHFGGVPHVTVPDCLKQGVTKCHLYDPDINPSYVDLAKFYDTAIVPARPGHPKDKAIVEGAVKLVKRYFKWLYRGHTFTSLSEINKALGEVTERINKKPHTRFKISRYQRWMEIEKAKLKPLPNEPYEYVEWKQAKVHPDCHVSVESDFYSVPHVHRGKAVKVKVGRQQVEIYFDMERIAIHPRCLAKAGKYITTLLHLPPNSRAYRETTPRNILSQAKFINKSLYDLIDETFQEDTLGNLRRALGLVRTAREDVNTLGYETAQQSITQACETMRRFNKIRVPYFKELLREFRKEKYQIENREIIRNLNNPMLRYQERR